MSDLIESHPCRRGCTLPPVDGEDPKAASASVGHYCERDATIVTNGLGNAVGLAEHLPELITLMAARKASESMRTKSAGAPLPMSVAALDALNWTFAQLAYWSERWATALGLPAPALPRRVWRDSHGNVIGLPFGTTAIGAVDAVGAQARWQARVLPLILASDRDVAVELWFKDLARMTSLAGQFPVRERATYSRLMVCPDDGARVLVMPPETYGADRAYVCSTCGRHFTETEHDDFSALLVEMVKRKRKAAA